MTIAVIWAIYRWQTFAARFVVFFMAIALVTFMAESLAEGVADNAIFELTVAAAIGLGRAFGDLAAIPTVRSWGLERTQVVVVCILIVRFLLSQHVAPYLFLVSSSFRAELNQRVSIMKAETARIAAIPGPVVCDFQMPCRFAGKPFVFDPFIVGQLVATGRLSPQDVAGRIDSLKICFEKIDRRVDVADGRSSMIRKSGRRFSEKIMLQQKIMQRQSIQSETIAL